MGTIVTVGVQRGARQAQNQWQAAAGGGCDTAGKQAVCTYLSCDSALMASGMVPTMLLLPKDKDLGHRARGLGENNQQHSGFCRYA